MKAKPNQKRRFELADEHGRKTGKFILVPVAEFLKAQSRPRYYATFYNVTIPEWMRS